MEVHERAALRDKILDLRLLMKTGATDELSGCLDSAERLLGPVDEGDGLDVDERLRTARRLVELVDRSLSAFDGEKEAKQAPEADLEGDLRRINDMVLGEILVQLGMTTEAQVAEATALQSRTGMPVGEALVTIGALPPGDVQIGVSLQHHLRKAAASAQRRRDEEGSAADDSLLGEILWRLGVISREQLEEALEVQRVAELRIGTALAAIGAARWEEIWGAVRMQKRLRATSDIPASYGSQHPDAPTVIHLD